MSYKLLIFIFACFNFGQNNEIHFRHVVRIMCAWVQMFCEKNELMFVGVAYLRRINKISSVKSLKRVIKITLAIIIL